MPTASAFTALGVGNGFTTCALSHDVEGFTEWSTLGGYKKGDPGLPTAEQIRLSYVRAMSIFWNLYDLTGTATSQTQSGTTISSDGLMSSEDVYEINYGEPRLRVCESVGSYGIDVSGDGETYDTSTTLRYAANGEIYRMLEGGEFIGYGFGILKWSYFWVGSPIGGGGYANSSSAYVCLASATIGTPLSNALFANRYDGLNNLISYSDHNIAYLSISGIPFVCTAVSSPSGNDVINRGTTTVNAASMSASVSYDPSQTSRLDSTVDVQLSALDFYTYL